MPGCCRTSPAPINPIESQEERRYAREPARRFDYGRRGIHGHDVIAKPPERERVAARPAPAGSFHQPERAEEMARRAGVEDKVGHVLIVVAKRPAPVHPSVPTYESSAPSWLRTCYSETGSALS